MGILPFAHLSCFFPYSLDKLESRVGYHAHFPTGPHHAPLPRSLNNSLRRQRCVQHSGSNLFAADVAATRPSAVTCLERFRKMLRYFLSSAMPWIACIIGYLQQPFQMPCCPRGKTKCGLPEHVPKAKQQHARSRRSIASGASGFLDVSLQALRYRGMDYKPDVGLIDSHPEGDRGAQHSELSGKPLLVHEVSRLRRELRVVEPGAHPIRHEDLAQSLAFGPG
mmetsp:Transcript_1589/g.3633  ORF Transcript_1589/g.3633 Transcript_1589/m.3633 type:complete len:223 (+) Transcript_1589:735-1403(+)